MDLKLLEAFRAVIDNQSVTGAARVLGVTQPTVSAQISRLEAQVGFNLFDRVGGRLRASEKGRCFYNEVCTTLRAVDQLGHVADSIRCNGSENVAVASHPSASISLLPQVIAELLAKRPRAHVHMINRTSEEVRAIFEAGGADIAIAEWPIHMQGVEPRRYEVECVAVVPRGHALAGRQIITPRDLSDEPFVAMSESRLIGHRIRSGFEGAGAKFAPVLESEYFSAICCLVATGCGVSVVDRWSAETFGPMGLASLPFVPRIGYEIGVYRRPASVPAPLVDDIMQLIGMRIGGESTRVGAATAPTMEFGA